MKDIKGHYARACEYSLLLYSSIFWFYIDSVSPLLLLFLFFYFYYLFILSISSENEYIQLMAGGFPFALFFFSFHSFHFHYHKISICSRCHDLEHVFVINESQPFTIWVKRVIVMTPFCYTVLYDSRIPNGYTCHNTVAAGILSPYKQGTNKEVLLFVVLMDENTRSLSS